jgi:Alpha/beta hydrolase family
MSEMRPRIELRAATSKTCALGFVRPFLLLLAVGSTAAGARGQDLPGPGQFIPPSAPAAQAESFAPPLAQYQAVPPPPAPTTVPGTGVPNVAVPPAGLDGYWIASSWNCRQSAPHACPCGDLQFYYRSCDGQTQLLNRDAFNASLAPGTPVCFVVHGSFTDWNSMFTDCVPLFSWIRSAAPSRAMNVVFYTWPSAGPLTYEPHIDVAVLGKRASFNGVYLGDLIARVPPGHPICIIGHSHGARMTAAALHLLGGGEVEGTHLTNFPPPDQRIRAVLVAGALDHHWMDPGQRFGLALCRTECLMYLRNDHDIVLTFYPLRKIFSRRALGESGLTRRDHERLGYLNSKVVELDVTNMVQLGHVWNHYYTHPELASAIEPFVYFDDGPRFVPPTAPASVSTENGMPNGLAEKESRRGFFRSRFVKAGPGE